MYNEHYDPGQPRDNTGKWKKTPGYISSKINDNKSEEENILDRVAKAKAKGIDEEGNFREDSLNMHTSANGELTPEREALHNEIIDDFLSKGGSKKGIAYNLGGAPANGKSTLVDSKLIGNPENVVHIDPDQIKARLPEYKAMTSAGDFQAASFTHEESSLISKKLLAKANERKLDMVVDGVGDGGIDKIEAKVAGMKRAGFYTRADYVSLDTDLSLNLATARALKTGREVPKAYIEKMNSEISHLVPELQKRNVFDELNLWDTNIAGKPRLVFSKKDGIFTIHDKELYNRFLSKAK